MKKEEGEKKKKFIFNANVLKQTQGARLLCVHAAILGAYMPPSLLL